MEEGKITELSFATLFLLSGALVGLLAVGVDWVSLFADWGEPRSDIYVFSAIVVWVFAAIGFLIASRRRVSSSSEPTTFLGSALRFSAGLSLFPGVYLLFTWILGWAIGVD